MTSTNEILPLNIILKYTYIDDDNEEQTADFNIIQNGNFNMNNIRNINFYDNYINNNKSEENTNNVKHVLKDKLEDDTDNNINFKIKLPFSKNYITKENMDLVVTEEEKNESEITSTYIGNILSFYKNNISPLKELIEKNTISNDKIKNLNKDNFLNIIKNDPDDNKKKKDKVDEEISKLDFKSLTYINLFAIFDILIKNNIEFYAENNNKTKYNNYMKNVKESMQLLESKLKNKTNIFNQFKNKNYKHFFHEEHVIDEYFKKLEENLDKNIQYDSRYSNKELGYYSSTPKPLKLNTKDEFLSILYEYGKYIVSEEDYKKYKNKKEFYDTYMSQELIIKKIITYYNAYTILKNIYLIENTILFKNSDKNNKTHKNDKTVMQGSNYKYIKKIKCIPQLPYIKMKDKNLNLYFDLIYEEINEYSIINFFINFINTENYTSKDINKKENSYINYRTKIYSNKKNINDDIYFSPKIDYEKLIKDFKLLNTNNEIFKKESLENIQEALVNKKITLELNKEKNFSNYIKKNEPDRTDVCLDCNIYTNIIENDLMKQIFLKKDNLLFVNNKYYTISKIEFNETIINDKKRNQENQEKTKKINKNFIEYDNQDIRLNIDYVNKRYNTYLNVYCYIKKTKDEKITFKNKFNNILNCNDKANNLDILFKKLMGEYYDNYFKKLLNPNYNSKQIDELINNGTSDDYNKEKEFLNMKPLPSDDNYLSSGGKINKNNKIHKFGKNNKINKIHKLEKNNKINKNKINKNIAKLEKKYKRKNSFKNKRKKFKNKTIKLINLYLKNY
jgi:hypothetical protein